MRAVTHDDPTQQNAIDRIVWALYARPRAVPAFLDVLAATDVLKASGVLTRGGATGHYVLDRHIPAMAVRFDDGLLCSDDVGAARLAQLVAGAAPSAQERQQWRRRWTLRALGSPDAHELPAYRIGPIQARTGELAFWLATFEGDTADYLGVDLFGFACSSEEIFMRFRATVVAASAPAELEEKS